MTDIYYELSLKFLSKPGVEEVLKQTLSELSFNETDLIVAEEGRYQYIKMYFDTKRSAQKVSDLIGKIGLKGVKVRVNELGPADWRDKWKEDLKPFKLTERFDVVPTWQEHRYHAGKRIPLYLDTTLAFGTGLHETTRFTAQLIEQCAGRFSAFLDIGTGTGLLTMVAHDCGAQELWAVDIDPSSIRMAQQNLDRNGLTFDRSEAIDFRKFKSNMRFDMVAANVMTDELVDMRAKIVSVVKPGQYLILSGISLGNLTQLKRAFQDQPLRCLRIIKGKKWAAVLYKKKGPKI